MATTGSVFFLYFLGVGFEGQLLAFVFHEANSSMELIIARCAEYHIALCALKLGLFLAAIALLPPSLLVPPNHLKQLRALACTFFPRLPRSSALAG